MTGRPRYDKTNIKLLRRQIAGTVAKANGRRFEEEIEATCAMYRQQGVATINRNHPRTAGPPGRMWFAGKGDVDFTGHVRGVPIAFDAKSSSNDPCSWSYPERDLHQVRFLLDWKRIAGEKPCYAFILLRCDNRAYLLYDLETLAAGGSIILRDRYKNRSVEKASKRFQPFVFSRVAGGSTIFPFLDPPQ